MFWDIEDCPIPDGLSPSDVEDNIAMALSDKGYSGSIKLNSVFGDFRDTISDDFAGFCINNSPDSKFLNLYNIFNFCCDIDYIT